MSFLLSDNSTCIQLLDQARDGDADAWRRMTDLYGPLTYRWARQMGLQPTDAADVTQDVFISVAKNLSTFRYRGEGDSFRAWLRVLVRNQVRLLWRRRGDDRPVGGAASTYILEQLPDTAESTTPDRPSDRGLLAARALSAIRGDFEGQTWNCFWRVAIENHSPAEVAQEFGMTPTAVRQAKYRVLCRLREELEAHSSPPANG